MKFDVIGKRNVFDEIFRLVVEIKEGRVRIPQLQCTGENYDFLLDHINVCYLERFNERLAMYVENSVWKYNSNMSFETQKDILRDFLVWDGRMRDHGFIKASDADILKALFDALDLDAEDVTEVLCHAYEKMFFEIECELNEEVSMDEFFDDEEFIEELCRCAGCSDESDDESESLWDDEDDESESFWDDEDDDKDYREYDELVVVDDDDEYYYDDDENDEDNEDLFSLDEEEWDDFFVDEDDEDADGNYEDVENASVFEYFCEAFRESYYPQN